MKRSSIPHPVVLIMNIGPAEIIVVLVIALLVFGPKRLPQMGRSLGRGVREFRNAAATARSELGIDDVISEVNGVKDDVSSAAGLDELKTSVADVTSSLGVDDLTKGIDDMKSSLKIDLKGTGADKSATAQGAQVAAAAVTDDTQPAEAVPAGDPQPPEAEQQAATDPQPQTVPGPASAQPAADPRPPVEPGEVALAVFAAAEADAVETVTVPAGGAPESPDAPEAPAPPDEPAAS